MTIVPINDNVLVEKEKSATHSAGGIFIPEGARKKTQIGTVVAVGEGKMLSSGIRQPIAVVPGDKIIHPKYSGEYLEVDGKEVFILSAHEIIGVLLDW